MNIAIPVSNHDKHLLPTFVKVLQHFGGLEEASLCFFTTPSAKAEAHEAANALNATVHTFEVDFAGGWPVASGSHFAATVFTIPNIGWNGPWLWMELDMLPVKRGWVQAIRNGYTLCGSPFMGNVVPTAWVEEGKLVVKEDDLMMMGCGVYPANMDRDQRFRPLLSDLVKPPPRNPNTPFDFYLRHAMSQAGIANTTLIADMWQTCEYKRTGKGITCKPVPLDKPRRERGGLVPPEAVIVHGCKDGSLAELVLSSDRREQVRESVAALSANPEKAPLLEKILETNLLPSAVEVVNQLKHGDADPAKRLPLPLVAHITEQVGFTDPAFDAPADVIVMNEDESETLTQALEAPAAPPPAAVVEAVQLHQSTVTDANGTHTEESLNAPRPSAATGTFTLPPTPEAGYSILPAPTVTDASGTRTLDVAILKPKPPTRTTVEALRKSKKGVAVEIARALNLPIGEFAKLLPELGYVIVKGGKLQSTK